MPADSGPTATAPPTVAPHAAIAVPRARALELLRDEGQRGREHRRAADALQGADQISMVIDWPTIRTAAKRRGEDRESADEDPLSTEPVGEDPAR